MLRGLGRYAVAVVAVVALVGATAVVVLASPSADPQHGITVSKGCQNPKQIGGAVTCSFTVSNQLDSVNQAHDTVTITSITDVVVTAGGPAASGELISTLLITPQGGATCNVSGALPGTGNTLCTLPFGGFLTTNAISLYSPITAADFTTFQNTHRLLDNATFVWHDLCDGLDANPTPGGGNCNPEPGPANAGGSTLIVAANIQITPATDTDPVNDNHVLTGHVNVSCETVPADAACTNGNGFKNAPAGTTINFSIVSGPGSFVGPNSCATVLATGECTVTITSATPGTTVVNAATDVTVSGLSLHRATGDANVGDSANAVKNWAGPAIVTNVRNAANVDVTNTAVPAGTVVHDEATVTKAAGTPAGAPNPTGTVSFTLYTGGTCNGSVLMTDPNEPLNGSGVATSATFTTPAAGGSFSYLAHYNGDASYPGLDAACEPFSVTPQVVVGTETAFAKDPAGNNATCFLNIPQLNNNRWGWTNGPYTSPSTHTLQLWAGAGQCDTSKGTLAGNVVVVYSGTTVTVTYNMTGGHLLCEAHAYVGTDILPKKNGSFTVAPGQYPKGATFSPCVATATLTFTGISGNIFVVAHGVVTT